MKKIIASMLFAVLLSGQIKAKTVAFLIAYDNGTPKLLLTKKTWGTFHPFYVSGGIDAVKLLIADQTAGVFHLGEPVYREKSWCTTIVFFEVPFVECKKLYAAIEAKGDQQGRDFTWVTDTDLQEGSAHYGNKNEHSAPVYKGMIGNARAWLRKNGS